MKYLQSFLAWAREVSLGPNDKPSSQRVAGLLTVSVLQIIFATASVMLIHRGNTDAFQKLFDSNAILCATLLGLITVSKFGGKDKPEGTP